jgi:hypothetical protein
MACFEMTFNHNAEDPGIALGNLGCLKKATRVLSLWMSIRLKHLRSSLLQTRVAGV